MEPYPFILSAYAFTGISLAALCLATWRAGVRVRKQLGERERP